MKIVERCEDMSTLGRLRLIRDDDGDIIVAVQPEKDGRRMTGSSVEFCAGGAGGGKSPRTRKALAALMVAMEADNGGGLQNDPITPLLAGDAACDDSGDLVRLAADQIEQLTQRVQELEEGEVQALVILEAAWPGSNLNNRTRSDMAEAIRRAMTALAADLHDRAWEEKQRQDLQRIKQRKDENEPTKHVPGSGAA